MGGPGNVVAAVAALVLSASAFLPWTGERAAYDLPLDGLWEGFTVAEAANPAASLMLGLLFVAFVFAISAVSGSRLIAAIGSLLGAGLVAGWVDQSRGRAATLDFLLDSSRPGAWLAALAVLIGLLSALMRRQFVARV